MWSYYAQYVVIYAICGHICNIWSYMQYVVIYAICGPVFLLSVWPRGAQRDHAHILTKLLFICWSLLQHKDGSPPAITNIIIWKKTYRV